MKRPLIDFLLSNLDTGSDAYTGFRNVLVHGQTSDDRDNPYDRDREIAGYLRYKSGAELGECLSDLVDECESVMGWRNGPEKPFSPPSEYRDAREGGKTPQIEK